MEDPEKALPELLNEIEALRARVAEFERAESEWKQLAAERRDSEARLQLVLDQLQAIIWSTDTDLRFTSGSGAGLEQLGLETGQTIGISLYEYFQTDDAEFKPIAMHLRALKGESVNYDQEWAGRVFEVHLRPLRDGEGRIIGTLGASLDITERKQAEEALKKSERNYREIFNASNDAIFVHDIQTGAFLDVNRAGCEMFGYTYDEIMGLDVGAISLGEHPYTQENAGRLVRKAVEEGPQLFEWRGKKKNGELFWIEPNLKRAVIGGQERILAFVRDITERKRSEEERRKLEAQMQEAQKLESLGVLAGGIAHDFNNLLMNIVGTAAIGLMDLPEASRVRDHFTTIKEESQRAAELCTKMLAYSGKGRRTVETIDLNRVMVEMEHLLETCTSENAALKYGLADSLPEMAGDPAQIHLVIMNLVVNASEAIGDKKGTITVTTGSLECDREYLAGAFPAEKAVEGTYVYLEVEDTGSGMDEETLSKMFDPFFTTKFIGRGLGLAAVLGIVRAHGGAVKVQSEPGRGTTFRVLFPSTAISIGAAGEGRLRADSRMAGTILVIDDEETILSIVKNMLEAFGYKILTAADGATGLTLFRDNAEEIDVVILDLAMPRMSGREILHKMRDIKSGVRVILSTGISEEEVARRLEEEAPAAFIRKPYSASALAEKVREAMGGR